MTNSIQLTPQAISKACRAFADQADDLNGAFLERRNEIAILQTSFVSGEPAVFISEAGTGKSQLINCFADTFEAVKEDNVIDHFQYLINRYTTPAELFGITDVKRLRETGEMVVNTNGKLPQARFAFIDEVFKANSATLNSLLTILNEKQFDDGSGVRKDVPLEMLIGASNELPEEDSGLEALWDRFVLRHFVKDIKREDSFISLLTGEGIGEVSTKVSRQDVMVMRELAGSVDISGVLNLFVQLRRELDEKGIRVSARRWRKAINVVKAQSALKGRTKATTSDCGILACVLWDQPDQIPTISAMLAKHASADVNTALRLMDSAREIHNGLQQIGENLNLRQLGNAKRQYAEISKQLEELDQSEEAVTEAIENVNQWRADLQRLTVEVVRGS